MVAQAIEGAIHPSVHLVQHNQTSFTSPHNTPNENISVATTLALLVGLVQVGLDYH